MICGRNYKAPADTLNWGTQGSVKYLLLRGGTIGIAYGAY